MSRPAFDRDGRGQGWLRVPVFWGHSKVFDTLDSGCSPDMYFYQAEYHFHDTKNVVDLLQLSRVGAGPWKSMPSLSSQES
jgi:hypothetical protein